jgi:hypothetical protein
MTRFLTHPANVLGALAGLSVLLLALPIRLPLGGNYFDLYFIMDGAYRVGLGQIPHADFFAPSGALSFYLLAGAERLFPRAQPLLAAQLSMLALTLPLMFLAAIDVDRRSRLAAFALVAPFAIFSLAPINAIEFYPAPGADGIGVYNRQSGLVLYALMAAMFLMAEGWRRNLVLALALAALFYIKINVFLPALVLMAFGFVSGLLAARSAAIVLGTAFAAIVAAGAPTGLLAPYLSDVAAMVAHNRGHALSRMATMFSVKFDVIMTMSALILALLALRFAEIWRLILKLAHGPAAERLWHLRRLLQHDVALIGVGFTMSIVIEMQNTGSQEFVYLWPLLLAALTRLRADAEPRATRWKPALMMLFAAATLPTMVTILHRSARMIAVAPTYASLGLPELEALDRVVVRPENLAHARAMSAHYAGARANFTTLAEAGHMPSSILWSHIEYQAFYLLDLADAAAALRRLEASTGRTFASVYTPDNVDMMPYALGRAPLKDVTVSLDFGRGFPASRQAKLIAAADRADAIFLRRCPVTPYALDIVKLMQPALTGRDMIALTPCWDVAVKR